MENSDTTGRTILQVTGGDREHFLQGLVTNDVGRLRDGLVYAALLTPQGKYLADFFLVPSHDAILIDVADPLAQNLMKRLTLYKLRADVQIAPWTGSVSRGLGAPPEGAFTDPRDEALGWRLYGPAKTTGPDEDWDAIRVARMIPESGIELIPDETYILEAGFERLNGVDFRKGCFVGQEIVARMKHKTTLRRGLVQVELSGAAPVGSEIVAGGKPVGRLFTQSGNRALAQLRLDKAKPEMQAGEATIHWTQAA